MVLNKSGLKTEVYRQLSREDDPRLSEFIQLIEPTELAKMEKALVLLGYSDDYGVKANGGRVGAKDGPRHIRQALARLVSDPSCRPIADFGDVTLLGDLVSRQKSVADFLSQLPKDVIPVSLGGGHDWAYPDGQAFIKKFSTGKKKVVIINIDAHLDVRRPTGGPHSGSAFRQLIDESGKKLQLFQIGFQDHVNSKAHIDYCRKNNVTLISLKDIKTLPKTLSAALKGSPDCFLSVDIDGFSSSIAPGCSAPSPAGLLWPDFHLILDILKRKTKLRGLGIYEVNPIFDRDSQTAKLAAQIIFEFWRGLK